ncbi:DUF4249 family protein [Robertkochia flava]|uniref:DUF4249 family protein n=1 Tax=Robertkochia flava TaxID=3447986 RepID=UPI001CCAECCB|nr:DUF4249 family protein [Robertkochia marina]
MRRFFILYIFLLLFTSCEDVVDIDLNDPEPRLVVDALLRVDSESPSNRVSVKLLLSSNFFEDNTAVNDASVSLLNVDTGQNILLPAEGNNGVYSAVADTDVLTSGTLELQITYNGILYTAINEFAPSTPIVKLEQGTSSLFDDEDIEIIIGYEDPADQTNYYLLDYDQGEYFTSEDTFYPGQYFEFSYFHGKAIPGDTLEVYLLGANQEFINYMNQVLELSGEQGLTPFQTPVSAARGNIVGPNDTSMNFALGYFAVLESYSQTLIVE